MKEDVKMEAVDWAFFISSLVMLAAFVYLEITD